MKVIIVSSAGLATGGARQALYQARALLEAGFDVRFACPANSELRRLDPNLDWAELPAGKIAALPAINRALRALLPTDGESAVVHAFHNWAVKAIGYLGTLWRLQGLPVVCLAHRGVTNKPGNPLPYLLPGLRAYIANSSLAAAQLPLLWRRRRCHLISNAVPPERLKPSRGTEAVLEELNIPPGRFILGDVAHDKPEKGVARLLHAYAQARAALPPSNLVIVGVKPETWLPLCRELGLEEQVRLVPRTERVADYVQTFSLFVFPSYFIESQPNVVMEAMCLGKPVIGSDVGGVKELIGLDFTFKAGDPGAMAAKILQAAANPARLERAAAANLKASQAFAPQNRLKAILGIYRSILEEAELEAPPQ